METQNLWPDFLTEDTKTPRAILQEQAAYLAKRTNNALLGEVWQLKNSQNENLVYSFNIVAPALQNYRYQLLTVSYTMPGYPVSLGISWIDEEDSYLIGYYEDIQNEEVFIKSIEEVFKNHKTQKVISALLAESRRIGETEKLETDNF
jgi:hypothetical protein